MGGGRVVPLQRAAACQPTTCGRASARRRRRPWRRRAHMARKVLHSCTSQKDPRLATNAGNKFRIDDITSAKYPEVL